MIIVECQEEYFRIHHQHILFLLLSVLAQIADTIGTNVQRGWVLIIIIIIIILQCERNLILLIVFVSEVDAMVLIVKEEDGVIDTKVHHQTFLQINFGNDKKME